MLMFGGVGVIAGALVGAIVLGALPEVFRFISDYRLLTFGAILVLMLRFQPQGLLGLDSAALRAIERISQGWMGRHGPAPGAGKTGESRGPA